MTLFAALLLCAASAFALNKPGDTKDIDAMITQANSLTDEIKRLRGAGASGMEIQRVIDARDLLYQEAVQKTLIAYGIVPADKYGKPLMGSGTAQEKSVAGRQIQWTVVYGEDRPWFYIANPTPMDKLLNRVPRVQAKTLKELNPDADYGGVTSPDGMTALSGRFGDADDLAAILVHESIHFEQDLDPARANLSLNQGEVDGWSRTRDRLKDFIVNPTKLDEWKGLVNERVNKYRAEVATDEYYEKLGKKRPSSVIRPGAGPEKGSEQLADLKSRGEELEAVLREQAWRRHILALQSLAERACYDLPSVEAAMLAELKAQPRERYRNIQQARYPGEPCRESLYAALLSRLWDGKSVDSDWLEWELAQIAADAAAARPPEKALLPGEQPPVVEAPVGAQSRTPIFGAFDLARLAKTACLGRPDMSGFGWFPDKQLSLTDAPLAELSGCSREVYQRLLDANKEGKALSADLLALPAVPGDGGGSGSGPSEPDRGTDLSWPKQYIPTIRPRF